MIYETVQELTSWQTNKYTHRRTGTTENNTTFAMLSLRGWQ